MGFWKPLGGLFLLQSMLCIVFRPGDCLLVLIYLLTQINNDQDCEYLRIIGLPKTTTHKAEKAWKYKSVESADQKGLQSFVWNVLAHLIFHIYIIFRDIWVESKVSCFNLYNYTIITSAKNSRISTISRILGNGRLNFRLSVVDQARYEPAPRGVAGTMYLSPRR